MSRLPLLHLLRYAKSYRPQIWGAIACSILNTIFDLAPPYLIGIAIDVVVQAQNSFIAQYSRLWRNLAQTLQHELRVDAYRHLQDLELGYFEEHSTGGLLSVLNDDINQLERFLNFGAHDILHFVTTVLFVGTTFVALAPGVSWWAMAPIPFVLWGSIVFQAKLASLYDDVREKSGLISTRLANNLSGIATIKSFTSEPYERDRVQQESEAYRRSNGRAIALSAAFVPVIRIVILVGFTATLFLGGVAVASDRLSAGTYGFLVFIIQRLLWPFTDLSELMDEYQRAMSSVRRVMALLDTPIAIPTGQRAVSTLQGEIQLRNVTFAYRDRAPVLRQLSMQIPAKTSVGIVGATGSGKSTLVKLLLRLYEVQQGQILLDGIDIRELNLRDLQRCIGWVSQDVFLFHGTVADNIRYGSFSASPDQIRQAAKLAEAHRFIEQLPQGYDTIVGEQGQWVESGTHEHLLGINGLYANLWQVQTGSQVSV